MLIWYNSTGDDMLANLKGSWLVGVSGQNDSMALLAMCLEAKLDVMACIIDYHQRDAAQKEIAYVQAFCEAHQVPLFIIKAPVFKGNFQKQARDFRYQSFKELIEEHQLEGVLLAHHFDDHLETILWQFERQHRVQTYGLKETTMIEGVVVKRPLLKLSKKQLQTYNQNHGIKYFEDESNRSMKYTRNRIRQQLSKVSDTDKDALLKKADKQNQILAAMREKLKPLILDQLKISDLLEKPQAEQHELLWLYLEAQAYPYAISKRQLNEIIKQVTSNLIGQIPLRKPYYLYYQGQSLDLITEKNCHYEYTFDTIRNINTKHFSLHTQGDAQAGFEVLATDFPITIRNARAGDKIKLEFGHQKLTTWFNQMKIPWYQRQSWPVVVNKNQELIYVVGWRCDINHSTNNPNLFVLK